MYVGVDSRQSMTIIGPARVFSLSPESYCREIQMEISVACPRIGVTVTRGRVALVARLLALDQDL